jgi:hypothetical protein
MKIIVRLIDAYRRFGGTYCLHIQGSLYLRPKLPILVFLESDGGKMNSSNMYGRIH